uniref:RING-type domain-containing protein n=1 Tax=Leersia perrieri TaxID=77586 RepID=A0A0D9V244_9ORYZ
MNTISTNRTQAPSPSAATATSSASASASLLQKNGGNSHVVIDIDDDDGSESSSSSTASSERLCCVVCTEPMEFVAVGRCGHAVVCSGCAARIRSSNSDLHTRGPDLRCCICRRHCPLVAVTRASAADTANGVNLAAGMPPANIPHEWRALGYNWYCPAMSAYFDDKKNYKATRAIARGRVNADGGCARSLCEVLMALVLVLVVGLTILRRQQHSSTSSSERLCCVVCTEPMEYIAVGRCGHAVVCSGCAARMRSFNQSRESDLRCCICRAHCPLVAVTKAVAAVDGDKLADMPAANVPHEWRALGYNWYCPAMSAYFDDVQQYNAANAIARGRVKLGGGAVVGNGGADGRHTRNVCVDVGAGHSHVIDIPPQMDASSSRSAVEMAQLDTTGRSASSRTAAAAADEGRHVVVNIDAGDRRSTSTGSDGVTSCCVVCTEPLVWVAIGQCGHRVVCSACTARVRSGPDADHRCCICRTVCPTVLVTKAAKATPNGEVILTVCPAVLVTKTAVAAPNGEVTLSMMPAATEDGRVGDYWYCAAVSAYFDDEKQYKVTYLLLAADASLKKLQQPPVADDERPPLHGQDDDGDGVRRPKSVLCQVFMLVLIGAFIGMYFVTGFAKNWVQGIAIELASVTVTVLVLGTPTCTVQGIPSIRRTCSWGCMAQLHANNVGDAVHSHVIDMPQLDSTSSSAAAAAAAGDNSLAVDMGRPDTNGCRTSCATANDGGRCHVVINVDAGDRGSTGSDDVASCVVCMEPLEWVAVGPCGHRVVCSMCAARVRAGRNADKRCCICRTLCPTVFITKAAAAAMADGDSVPTFSNAMLTASQDGRVGDYWYCVAMSAYFDDERQYEATAKAAAAAASSKQQRPRLVAVDGAPVNQYGTAQYFIYTFYIALFGMAIGMVFAVDANGWGARVAIVLGSGALSVALGRLELPANYIHINTLLDSILLPRIKLIDALRTTCRGYSVAFAGRSHVIIGMSRLDAISRRDAHRHVVIDIPPLDTNGGHSAAKHDGHVEAIDHSDGSTGSDGAPSCVVCTEPLVWAVVGTCGHRVVCSACTARVRSGPDADHRCCICRTFCPTVLVTKAAKATPNGEVILSMMPAANEDGRVGDYWYCAAVSAYFDEEQQYRAAKAAAALGGDVDAGGPANPAALFALDIFCALIFGVLMGVSIARVATDLDFAAVVSACTMLSVAFVCAFRFKRTLS